MKLFLSNFNCSSDTHLATISEYMCVWVLVLSSMINKISYFCVVWKKMKDLSVKFVHLHNNRSHVSDKTTNEIVWTRGFRLWFGIFVWNTQLRTTNWWRRCINWNESLIYATIPNLFAQSIAVNQLKTNLFLGFV